jgi:hypothetical protein
MNNCSPYFTSGLPLSLSRALFIACPSYILYSKGCSGNSRKKGLHDFFSFARGGRQILLIFNPYIFRSLTAFCYPVIKDTKEKGGSMIEDDRFMFLEIKATQIRKLLLGSLLLAKDLWKDELLRTPEGLDVMRAVEEAGEEFIDPSITHNVEKLDNILRVINKRARAFVVLIDYLARHKQ